MKYSSRITKTRNNAGLLGQIGRINDIIEKYGDCGTGISKITVIPNGKGGFNAEWSDNNGEGDVLVKGSELKRLLTSIARKLGTGSSEFRDVVDAVEDIDGDIDFNAELGESAFNNHCNEMLVLFNKDIDDKKDKDEPVVTSPALDGFTQAVNGVLSGIGASPMLPAVASGTDTTEPLQVTNGDSDDAEISLKDDKDGNLSVGEGQVGFEKVGNSLRIVFKDISVTLERKAVLALRDFVEDMDIDDQHGMMENEDDDDDSDDSDDDSDDDNEEDNDSDDDSDDDDDEDN